MLYLVLRVINLKIQITHVHYLLVIEASRF